MTKGFTVWFTGLSGTGKTTVSRLVEKELRARGYKTKVLDGDVVRENLSKGLGFGKEDRDTNIRRIGFVCELLTRNDVVAIAAAISPYRASGKGAGEIGADELHPARSEAYSQTQGRRKPPQMTLLGMPLGFDEGFGR